MVPSSCCPCIHGREETRALWTAHRGVLGVVERCQIVACKRLLTEEPASGHIESRTSCPN